MFPPLPQGMPCFTLTIHTRHPPRFHCRMHRLNVRLRLDEAMRDSMWKGSEAVCRSEEQSRAFLAALAPAHRIRLLSLVRAAGGVYHSSPPAFPDNASSPKSSPPACGLERAPRGTFLAPRPVHGWLAAQLPLPLDRPAPPQVAMSRVGGAYLLDEVARRPAVARAKELVQLMEQADSGEAQGAFDADPLVVRCGAVAVFLWGGGRETSRHAFGSALCALGAGVPGWHVADAACQPSGCLLLFHGTPLAQALQCLNQDKTKSLRVFDMGGGRQAALNTVTLLASTLALSLHALAAVEAPAPAQKGGAAARASEGTAALREQLSELLAFLAEQQREAAAGEKRAAAGLSTASLCDLLHARAALTAM